MSPKDTAILRQDIDLSTKLLKKMKPDTEIQRKEHGTLVFPNHSRQTFLMRGFLNVVRRLVTEPD